MSPEMMLDNECNREWRVNGKLHREYVPAVEQIN